MENEFIINSDAPTMIKYLFNGWIQIICDPKVATAFELNSIANIMVWRGINWNDALGEPETKLVPGPSWFQDEPQISVPKKDYTKPFIEIIMKNGRIHHIWLLSFTEGVKLGNEILSARWKHLLLNVEKNLNNGV